MKTCSACKVTKPYEQFGKNKLNLDGYNGKCKECKAAYNRLYREANAEKLRRKSSLYYINNVDALRDKARERYKKNPQLVNSINAKSVKKNQGRVTKYKHDWYEKNKERLALAARERYLSLSEEERVARLKIAAKWKRDNPKSRSALQATRRARKLQAGGEHTAADIEKLIELQKYKCIVCRACLKKNHHVDHIVPLAKGGTNDVLNLQILCPRCNTKKHSRDPVEFMQSNGFLL